MNRHSEHEVTLSEDFISHGIEVTCSCGWSGGSFDDARAAGEDAKRHYYGVAELEKQS